ncbi:MAG: helix-turn-helix transcriptional regulator [Erysipelotrichaceae bacterium]|nr:helix-turn-helix transcriptional regulator [Erysipelotrichaceae bacterium]
MPFIEIDIDELIKENMKDPIFAMYYEKSKLEVDLIGQIIHYRKKMNVSQQTLAQQSGVRQQVISRMERHQSFPNLVTLSKIAKALGLRLTFQEFKSTDQIKE